SYGVSASEPAMQRLVADLYQQLSAKLVDDITRQVTAQVTEQVTAQITQEVTEKVTRQLKQEHHAEILQILEQLQAERRRYFGPSADTAQGRLFDEAEAQARNTTEADETVAIPEAIPEGKRQAPSEPKARGKRAA